MLPDQESSSIDTFNIPEGLCCRFSLNNILAATNNFDDSFTIGQGGFAKVYKGKIDNGALTVAIKKSKSLSPELRKEFRDEILMVSQFRHTHLVSLIGYCETDKELILVYEYMPCGTLEDNLHKFSRTGNNSNNDDINVVPLCWVERLKISIGAARGQDYLHTGYGINEKVIHRDVKSSNILLDENRTTAKISDFGLSKIGPANQADTRVMTRVVGTFGYLDPEYYTTGFLTSKSDVYAFGVVLFELLCGRPPVDLTLDEDQRSLAGWARLCVKKGKVDQIIDPYLKSEILPLSLSAYVKIADRCLNARPKERPTMTEILAELILALSLQESGKLTNLKSSGASKIAKTLMLLFTGTPSPVLEFDATEAVQNGMEDAPYDTEAVPNDKQSVNIEHYVVPSIQIDELNNITNNFSSNVLIGKGDCGKTYYGILKSGQVSRIKMFKKFNRSEFTPPEEFQNQVTVLSNLKHENVAELLHYCVDGDSHFVVYEYSPIGSLRDIIHGQEGSSQSGTVLSWSRRAKIAFGAAKGLEYLHEKVRPNIIHRAIKSSNVLLFNDDVVKVTDIKFFDKVLNIDSRLDPASFFASSGRFDIAPEYAPTGQFDGWDVVTGQFSKKDDVYSFGVVLLELLTGRKAFDTTRPPGQENMVTWATSKLTEDKVKQCIDPNLKGEYHHKAAAKMAGIAALCVQNKAELRPTMSIVVEALKFAVIASST